MKNIARMLCAVLAIAMLLTGCTMPKINLPGTPDVAVTYGDQTISTGEYLAYLYMNFENVYYNYGLSSYASYGIDPWTSEYAKIPYDQADGTTVQLDLETYVIRATEDAIKRNFVVEKIMKDNGLSVLEEELKTAEKNLADMPENYFLPLGISDASYATAYKNLNLNEYSTFMGLYGKNGPKAVADADVRKYFDTNYLSYKIITASLTKEEKQSDGTSKTVPMTATEKDAELKKLQGYLATCNEKGFEAAMDAYNKANATDKNAEIPASKDEDNRQNVDATNLDEALAKAIRSVEVGKAKIVEYGGTEATDGKEATPNTTAALIMRLDINKPETLYADSLENILYSLKGEEFEKQVKDAMAALTVTFNEDVQKKCSPKKFTEQ